MQPTPIYGGGTRRSAAPTVFQIAPSGTGAATANSLLSAFSQAPAGASTVPSRGRYAETPTLNFGSSGFGEGTGATSGSSASQGGSLNQAIGAFGTLGSLAANLGFLGRDIDLMEFGSNLGKGASVANAVANPSFATVAPLGLSMLGVSAPLAGAVLGYGRSELPNVPGGVPGAVGGFAQGMLSVASPPLGALNAMLGMFGLPTIQSTVKGWATPVRDAVVSKASDLNTADYGGVSGFGEFGFGSASDFGLNDATNSGSTGRGDISGAFGFGSASDYGYSGNNDSGGGSANSGNGPGGSPNEGGLGGFGGW